MLPRGPAHAPWPRGKAPPAQPYLAAGAVAVGDWSSTHLAESPPVLSEAQSQLNKKVHTFLLPLRPQATPTRTPHVTGAERWPHPVT